jgi:hypothetical protein
MIYFDNLTFLSLLSTFIKYKIFSPRFNTIFFIDTSFFSNFFLIPVMKFCGLKVNQLDFKMIEVVDKNHESVRLRIHRVDLFNFYRSIEKSSAYKALFHKSWQQNNFVDYIHKNLVNNLSLTSTPLYGSVSRTLFKINVLKWHADKLRINEIIYVTGHLPWLNLFQEYANQFNIIIHTSRTNFFSRFNIKNYIRSKPLLYKWVKNLKYKSKVNANILNDENIKLFYDGRGDINLNNNGMHSDFFWQQNSDFQRKNVLIKHFSEDERVYLQSNSVSSINEGIYSDDIGFKKNQKLQINYSKEFKVEYKLIKSMLNDYDLDKFFSESLFRKFGVKIFMTWDRYTSSHIPLGDAIRDNGGIAVNYQLAFDGYGDVESLVNSDIVFSFSQFSADADQKLQAKIKYNVIIGYPKDYAASLLKDNASELREKMKAKGAKKIVLVLDENSDEDSRWHTGHELQRENYRFILEKVLKVPWLGVIFKPKRIIDLRLRLGPVADLLEKVEATGRCYIYENPARYTTIAPPILAGLSSDICIGAHLSGGTAALECALQGIPTLLIDRERVPYSKLSELPKGKVVFQDWPSTIDAIMEHFKSDIGTPGFGDWTPIIDDLDPFRDGLAAFRMGTYLKWLIEGFQNNLDREVIMTNAAKRYKKKWGADKVITS